MSARELMAGMPRADAARVTRPALGWPRVVSTGLLLAAAAAVLTMLVATSPTERVGWDFRFEYYPAAEAVAHGRSPYPALDSPKLRADVEEARAYPYPPLLAVALVPLTALSVDAATVLALLGSIAALVVALWILGVRDIRCYAAVMVWSPTWSALHVVNVSALLALGVALAWRYRATLWPLAGVLGLLVAVKLFVWPLVVWAAATRRIGAAAGSIAVGLVVSFLSWVAIGFEGMSQFPGLLRLLDEIHAGDSYSLVGIASSLGLGPHFGRAAVLAVGGALLAACVVVGRKGDDLQAFTLAIAASLALTPIAWLHYVLLFLAPLAVARPRFSAIWLLPVALWVCPLAGNGDGLQPFVPALAVALLGTLLVLRPTTPSRQPEPA